MQKPFDLLVVGDALVDVITRVDDDFLHQHVPAQKGDMTLISKEEAHALRGKMIDPDIIPGGSVANTLAGFCALGGTGAFIGKFADDELGRHFEKEFHDLNIAMPVPLLAQDIEPTGQCLICVTPDGERTMNTCLGACGLLDPDDVTEQSVIDASMLYIEGYGFTAPSKAQAVYKAIKIAKQHGRYIAFTLSSDFCITNFRSEFWDIINNDVDIVFMNEHEATVLCECNFELALERLLQCRAMIVITCGAKGAMVLQDGVRIDVPANLDVTVVDTTGAGDQFAAGFLMGVSRGMSLQDSAILGCAAAAEIIQQIGPRPKGSYAHLV